MHPFTPVPRSTWRRRDLRERGTRGRRWPQRSALVLLSTLALVTTPIALSSAPEPTAPGDFAALLTLRDDDAAARSGARAPTSTEPTTAAPTTPPPAASSPSAPTAQAAPTAPETLAAPAAPPVPTVSEEIVTRTNAERTAAGLAPLAVSACGTEQAAARTALLVAEDRFEHDPLEPVLEACAARAVGENLALGYPTPLAVVAGWMGSEGHRANILNPTYTQIGVACTASPKGQLCAQVFLG
ncbi:CAP domain-containing protein [Cellulomonas sp.]|uniref:CAP domain-containing protein n=1 Tax=Cellulomonas sp. TaxID=40001 RepID=UPI003BABCEB8